MSARYVQWSAISDPTTWTVTTSGYRVWELMKVRQIARKKLVRMMSRETGLTHRAVRTMLFRSPIAAVFREDA